MSEDKPITYHFMRKIDPSSNLKKSHWESTVVICWKDPQHLPNALDDGNKTSSLVKVK